MKNATKRKLARLRDCEKRETPGGKDGPFGAAASLSLVGFCEGKNPNSAQDPRFS